MSDSLSVFLCVLIVLFFILIKKRRRNWFFNLIKRFFKFNLINRIFKFINNLPNLLLSKSGVNLANKYRILKTFQILMVIGFVSSFVKLIRFLNNISHYDDDVILKHLGEISLAIISALSIIIMISFLFDLEKKGKNE